MIVLGINEDHNASCALGIDGKIIYCSSEERFTREKNYVGYPYWAIEEALSQTGVNKRLIDYVVFSTKFQDPIAIKIKKITRFKISDYIREMNEYWKPVLLSGKKSKFWQKVLNEPRFNDKKTEFYNYNFLKKPSTNMWEVEFKKERINAVVKHLGVNPKKVIFKDHHLSHASFAYFASPINKKLKIAVVTADSWGDGANASIFVGRGDSLKLIQKTTSCNLARIYRFITLLLGMKPNEHEYKVMGLAPYAKEYLMEPAYQVFKETLTVDEVDFKWRKKPKDLYFHFRERLQGVRFDSIAGGLQRWLEEILVEWINNILRATKTSSLVYSGGVSLNVKANKAISEIKKLNNFFVPPSGGDESTAMGAIFSTFLDYKVSPIPLSHVYLGHTIADQEVDDLFKKHRLISKFKITSDPSCDIIAKIISEGKILARCVGAMEFGARALGNRSIIADPSKVENIRKINSKIKFRDFWMPFTPTILDYRAKDYLVNPKLLNAPYMTLAFDTTELGQKHLIAAIHPADLTARPQVLERKHNLEYYKLIQAFEVISGVGALLNTSFNLHGEPIVRSAEDAYYTFINSGIDGLILNNKLVLKK